MKEIKLTPRQLQVAEQAAKGLCNKQIGRALGLSPETVKTHLRKIFELTGIKSRALIWQVFQEASGQNLTPEEYREIGHRYCVTGSVAEAIFEEAAKKLSTKKSFAGQQEESAAEHNLKDVRCTCCGYMTHQREHMGCIRAAYPQEAMCKLVYAVDQAVNGTYLDRFQTYDDDALRIIADKANDEWTKQAVLQHAHRLNTALVEVRAQGELK